MAIVRILALTFLGFAQLGLIKNWCVGVKMDTERHRVTTCTYFKRNQIVNVIQVPATTIIPTGLKQTTINNSFFLKMIRMSFINCYNQHLNVRIL